MGGPARAVSGVLNRGAAPPYALGYTRCEEGKGRVAPMRRVASIRIATAALCVALALVVVLALPSAAFAQEDHSHGEGSLWWPCSVFLASWLSAAVLFASSYVQNLLGGTGGWSFGDWFGQGAGTVQAPVTAETLPGDTGYDVAGPGTSTATSGTATTAEKPTGPDAPEESTGQTAPDVPQPVEGIEGPPDVPKDVQRRAADHEKLRWNPTTKRLEGRFGDTWVELGKGSWQGGKGGAPGHDPFSDGPAVADVSAGDVNLHKRGDQYSADFPSGRSGAPTQVTHNPAEDTSGFRRRDFSLARDGDAWSLADGPKKDRWGVSFDGSTDDFAAFRRDFSLGRRDGMWSVGDAPSGGRQWNAAYGDGKGYLEVGDRWIGRDGDQWGVGWKERSLGWNSRFDRFTYEHDLQGGAGSQEFTVGRDGQFGYSREQPVRVFDQRVKLKASFERYLESTGNGSERMSRETALGFERGKLKFDWKHTGTGTERVVRFDAWRRRF